MRCLARGLAELVAERCFFSLSSATDGVVRKLEREPTKPRGTPRFFFLGIAKLAVLCAFPLGCCNSEIARAQGQDAQKESYDRAVGYCRGNVERPMALDPDKGILCLDGALPAGHDLSAAKDLKQDGLFVVRSYGGGLRPILELADWLRNRRAIVIVYDYCLLYCADFLLFASEQAFVLKNSLVAWHYGIDPDWCPTLAGAKDEGPKRLAITPCSSAPPEYQEGYKRFQDIVHDFYAVRGSPPQAEWPPQSVFVRKILQRKFEGTGRVPDYYWTWNPRHVASAIKTKIVYEAYPQSQDEIAAIAARISLRAPVIYDP
jgi:hypothetical protein